MCMIAARLRCSSRPPVGLAANKLNFSAIATTTLRSAIRNLPYQQRQLSSINPEYRRTQGLERGLARQIRRGGATATRSEAMATTRSTDPLVWIDCEMTGLSPPPFGTDTILSVSCVITTSDLTVLDPHGFDAIIHHSASQLSSMSPWCIATHGASGLTAQCLSSTTTAATAAADLLAYIQKHVPEKSTALLAGNSVHADKMFLMQQPWDAVVGWLHYRIFDVSAVKEMVRRWCRQEVLEAVPVKEVTHVARKDVEESIAEARFYRGLLEKVTWS